MNFKTFRIFEHMLLFLATSFTKNEQKQNDLNECEFGTHIYV